LDEVNIYAGDEYCPAINISPVLLDASPYQFELGADVGDHDIPASNYNN
jgi:hypothetical protein